MAALYVALGVFGALCMATAAVGGESNIEVLGHTFTLLRKLSRAERGWLSFIGAVFLVAAIVLPLRNSGGRSSARAGTGNGTSGNHGSTSRPPGTRAALAHPVYLDTLPDTDSAGTEGVTPGQVTIDGRKYAHGIQFSIDTEAISGAGDEASYGIPPGARIFSAAIGNDDNQTQSGWETTALLYQVLVDNRRVATEQVTGHTHDPPFSVDVSGGGTIQLLVTVLGGGTVNPQYADWADPVFR